jgi:APA family basic amino acid/polyamine antiporter
VVVKLVVVLMVIVAGALYVKTANWHPFIPENTGTFGQFGWSGILRGAGVIFFAYIGFDAVSTAAQESRNPQKDMPIGILGSLVICTILYILVSGVMVGLVPYKELGVAAPMAVAIDAAKGEATGFMAKVMGVLPGIVKLGALAGLSSVMVVMLLGQTRVLMSMSNDGLLPAWAKKIHPKFRTPYINTILTGIVVAIAAGFTPIGILGELVSIGTLLAFVIVALGIIVLRVKKPNLHRPFKTPFVPVIPALAALVALGLMAGLPWHTWERLLIWMALGFVVYFAYGYRKSHLRGSSGAA